MVLGRLFLRGVRGQGGSWLICHKFCMGFGMVWTHECKNPPKFRQASRTHLTTHQRCDFLRWFIHTVGFSGMESMNFTYGFCSPIFRTWVAWAPKVTKKAKRYTGISGFPRWSNVKAYEEILLEEIPNNHLGCIKPCKYWDELPTSTGERQISSINSTFLNAQPSRC